MANRSPFSDDPSREVMFVDVGVPPADPRRPRVVWAAPGSLFIDEVDAAWARRCDPADLGSVTGPWAVVLWDPTGRHLLAVDPVGVQPLFWASVGPGRLAVSSWLDRLVEHADLDTTLDHEAVLWDRRIGLRVESFLDRTHFAAVRRVPGGRALHVSGRGVPKLTPYWDPRRLPGPDRTIGPADAAELLRERIDTAIRRLLPVDDGVGVGSHVSSGLDCTAVACRAAQHLEVQGRRLVAGYSWSPSESERPPVAGDERTLLDLVSTVHGFPIRRLPPVAGSDWYDEVDPHRYVPATIGQERRVLPLAAADGVGVLLTGWGGDELASFNGRMVVDRLVRQGRLRTVHRQIRARSELDGPLSRGRHVRQLAGAVLGAMPGPVQAIRHPRLAVAERSHRAAVDAILAEVSPVVADLERERRRRVAAVRDHHDLQLLLLTNGHLQHRTTWWYQAGRRFGIHHRHPLLDLGVVTAALSMPWWAYLGDGWRRVAYRTAVAGWVPGEIAWNLAKSEPSRVSAPVSRAPTDLPADDAARRVAAALERLAALPNPTRRRLAHRPVRARPDAAPTGPAPDPAPDPLAEARASRRRQHDIEWWRLPDHLGLRVAAGPVPDELPGADRPLSWIQTTRTATRVGFGPHNALLVTDGRDVTVQWRLDDDETDVDLGWVVQGWAVTLAMLQRGHLSLHASTVRLSTGEVIAIAGRQGAGKSTTAMGLRRRGHLLLVDDTTIVDTRGVDTRDANSRDANTREDGAWVTPYTRNVHLWPDSARELGVAFDALPPLAGRFGKSSFRPEEVPVDPVRLDRLVVLHPVDGTGPVTSHVVRGAMRIELLRRHLVRRGTAPLILGPDAFFAGITRLASAVDVIAVTRPVDRWSLDDVLDAVIGPVIDPGFDTGFDTGFDVGATAD